jgi:DtxR family transcriptional regulator, Mn-dependent transcriptional regulator
MHAETNFEVEGAAAAQPGHSHVIQDYAKAIYKLQLAGGKGTAVPNSALADALSVSPAAITSMLKRLEELELIEYAPYKGAALTPAG